jgi:hypothetical protein
MITHTPACIVAQQALAKYKSHWPNYCKTCYGQGFLQHVDFVDYGMAKVSMPSEDYCPDCIEYNKCPRCNSVVQWQLEQVSEDDFIKPCPNCGWSKDTEGLPDYGCECAYSDVEDFRDVSPKGSHVSPDLD